MVLVCRNPSVLGRHYCFPTYFNKPIFTQYFYHVRIYLYDFVLSLLEVVYLEVVRLMSQYYSFVMLYQKVIKCLMVFIWIRQPFMLLLFSSATVYNKLSLSDKNDTFYKLTIGVISLLEIFPLKL
jgi:hypothetical protein